jgi:hypothetical protein
MDCPVFVHCGDVCVLYEGLSHGWHLLRGMVCGTLDIIGGWVTGGPLSAAVLWLLWCVFGLR